MTTRETFEGIFLDLSKAAGKFRISEQGLGWKTSGGDPWTLDHSQIASASWSRAAKGFEVKIYKKPNGIIQLDGFLEEDFERLAKPFQVWYGLKLEKNDHILKGWNWGKGVFEKQELQFKVQNRPAFEIPYSEISNTQLAGRTEVALEFSLPGNGDETGTNGALGGARSQGRKSGAGGDQLVEMRFYIPGTAKKANASDDEGEKGHEDYQEEVNAANEFYDTLIEKAEIGEVAGDTYATFEDILHLIPRGRCGIDMYEASFRLRGKTSDYKMPYENVKKFMLLPKPDEVHMLIAIGLEPPIRQGQTRYPFIVMQFKRDDEIELDLNMTDELLKEKYPDKLQAHYEAPVANVIASVFRGLAKKRVITPSKEFMSHHQQSGVKCSIKASEGHLYCLDKAFIFVPKPATYIAFDNIASITLSRVGGAISASRTFDMTVSLKGGSGEHQFSNINREEQTSLEDFFKLKGIRTKNEMTEDSGAMLAAAMNEAGMASSDDEVVQAKADRGSADEDEESVDEDFRASSESDVAEEYDSAHDTSGSGSDVEMDDADAGPAAGDDDDETASEQEKPPPKKKTKSKRTQIPPHAPYLSSAHPEILKSLHQSPPKTPTATATPTPTTPLQPVSLAAATFDCIETLIETLPLAPTVGLPVIVLMLLWALEGIADELGGAVVQADMTDVELGRVEVGGGRVRMLDPTLWEAPLTLLNELAQTLVGRKAKALRRLA
ncbi:MAG: FACT complex subunit [Vezdaea aestivalis]|nr:MAG: FACT complex subunit [Vezdaea aestivalis]